jgi:hypothetical protein
MKRKISFWKKRPIKLQAVRDARRKKEKVTRGDKPGKSAKKPPPPTPGKINCDTIR